MSVYKKNKEFNSFVLKSITCTPSAKEHVFFFSNNEDDACGSLLKIYKMINCMCLVHNNAIFTFPSQMNFSNINKVNKDIKKNHNTSL